MSSPHPVRRALARGAAAALLGACAAAPAVGAGPEKLPAPAEASAAAGHRLHEGVAGATLLVTFADVPSGAEARHRLRGLGDAAPVVPEAGVWRLGPAPARAALRRRALARPGVAAAEWSLARSSDELTEPSAGPGHADTPPEDVARVTDPIFTLGVQWGLSDARGPSWSIDLTRLGPRPRIAVLDGGVDRSHEEWAGPGSPLVAPRNTIHRNSDAGDWGLTGHGTHVAGIAAAPVNGLGVVGVAPAGGGGGQVIPIRIADPDGRSNDATMAAGIRWAVLRGAKVVNISAGGPGYSRALQDTILWATQRGALVVASVGNDGGTSGAGAINYPAGYARVLGVAAQCDGTRSADCPQPFGLARFSNRNVSVDLIAPGVRMVSSVPGRVTDDSLTAGYAYKDGTSMAAPYVAGVAALVQAANGNRLSPYQVLRQLQNTATRLEGSGRNNRSGYGVIDPAAAVARPAPPDDVDEVNDDIRWVGRPYVPRPGVPIRIAASADELQDREDVYPVRVARGDRLELTLVPRSGMLELYLWGPGARTVATTPANVRRNLVRFRGGPARSKRIVHVVERAGTHHVNVYARRGRGDYTLVIAVRRS